VRNAFSKLLNDKEDVFFKFGLVWADFDLIDELVFIVVDDGDLFGLHICNLRADTLLQLVYLNLKS
jgi:hypothetical protein